MSTRTSAWVGPTRVIHRLERLIAADEAEAADERYDEYERYEQQEFFEEEQKELEPEHAAAAWRASGPTSQLQVLDFRQVQVLDVGAMMRADGLAAHELGWPAERRPETAPRGQAHKHDRSRRSPPAAVRASHSRRSRERPQSAPQDAGRRQLAEEHMALTELKAEVEQLLEDAQYATHAARVASDRAAGEADSRQREISTQTPGRPTLAAPAAATAAKGAAPAPAPAARPVSAPPTRLPPLQSLQPLPMPQTLSLPPLDEGPPPVAPAPRLVPLSLQQIIREETAAMEAEAEFSPGGGTLRLPLPPAVPAAEPSTLLTSASSADPGLPPSLETGLRMDGESFGAVEEVIAVAVSETTAAPTTAPGPQLEVVVSASPPPTPSFSASPRLPAEEEPTIIVVDGPASTAKSVLLQKLRELLPAPCLLISTATFTQLLPETVRSGDAQANAEWLSRCRAGMCGSLRSLAAAGNHLLVDFSWGPADVELLRSLCVALQPFQHALFVNAGEEEEEEGGGSNRADVGGGPEVVYDFDVGSLGGMDQSTVRSHPALLGTK